MATHSSILAWEIPWTEELGGLQSMGLQESDKTERLKHHHHHHHTLYFKIQETGTQHLVFFSKLSTELTTYHNLLYLQANKFTQCAESRIFISLQGQFGAFLVVLVLKNSSANAGDIKDSGSIPGQGRFLGEGSVFKRILELD